LSGLPLKHIDSETLLRDLRSAEEASKRKKKSPLPTKRYRGNSQTKNQTHKATMEHVVMRALVTKPNSPPSRQAASTRPSLNFERPALSHSKNAAKQTLKQDNSMSAYTINPASPPAEKLMIRSEPKSKLPPTVLAPLSSSSMSGLDQKQSHDGSTSSGRLSNQDKKSRLPWIRRNKKTTQHQKE
jgi:glucan-binding YG repeat protein